MKVRAQATMKVKVQAVIEIRAQKPLLLIKASGVCLTG